MWKPGLDQQIKAGFGRILLDEANKKITGLISKVEQRSENE